MQGLTWERLEKTTPRFITIQSLSDLSTAGVLPEEQETWRERTLPNLKVTIYIIESTLLRTVSFDPQNIPSGNPARYVIFSQAPWESSNSFLLLFLKNYAFSLKKILKAVTSTLTQPWAVFVSLNYTPPLWLTASSIQSRPSKVRVRDVYWTQCLKTESFIFLFCFVFFFSIRKITFFSSCRIIVCILQVT